LIITSLLPLVEGLLLVRFVVQEEEIATTTTTTATHTIIAKGGYILPSPPLLALNANSIFYQIIVRVS
jgi:hypothetical protein